MFVKVAKYCWRSPKITKDCQTFLNISEGLWAANNYRNHQKPHHLTYITTPNTFSKRTNMLVLEASLRSVRLLGPPLVIIKKKIRTTSQKLKFSLFHCFSIYLLVPPPSLLPKETSKTHKSEWQLRKSWPMVPLLKNNFTNVALYTWYFQVFQRITMKIWSVLHFLVIARPPLGKPSRKKISLRLDFLQTALTPPPVLLERFEELF